MAKLVALALDKATPQGRAPGAEDSYRLPRSVHVAEGKALISEAADGASAVAHILDTSNALPTAGAKHFSGRVNAVEKYYFTNEGVLAQPDIGGSTNCVVIGGGASVTNNKAVSVGDGATAGFQATVAGQGATGGSNDVVYGQNATGGAKSIALGRAVVAGNEAVSIGYLAKSGANGISVGNLAGFYETGASKLFIDAFNRTDEATARAEAPIYGVMSATVADQELHFNADVHIPQKLSCFGVTAAGQQAHIVDPAGGSTVDAEARTAVLSILSALETYGLLAAS